MCGRLIGCSVAHLIGCSLGANFFFHQIVTTAATVVDANGSSTVGSSTFKPAVARHEVHTAHATAAADADADIVDAGG